MTILVVGGGKMGMSHLALATAYVGKANLALCDSKFFTRLVFRFLGYRTVATVDAAARFGRLDGVLIATPTASHAALTRWAIDRRVPVFVEKPLTLDVERSRELTRLAAEAQVPAYVGFVMRHVASFQRLRHLVSSGALGKVTGYVAAMRGNVMTKPPADGSWQGDFGRGGGCLNEYGPHIIDLCHFVFGPIRTIDDAHMEQVVCTRADDRVDTDFHHADGTSGRLEIDWCDPSKRKSVITFVVHCEKADIRVDNSALEIDWRDPASVSLEERSVLDEPVQPGNVGFYLRGEEFSSELEAFLETCLGRRLSVDGARPADAMASLEDGCEVDRVIDEIARKAGLK